MWHVLPPKPKETQHILCFFVVINARCSNSPLTFEERHASTIALLKTSHMWQSPVLLWTLSPTLWHECDLLRHLEYFLLPVPQFQLALHHNCSGLDWCSVDYQDDQNPFRPFYKREQESSQSLDANPKHIIVLPWKANCFKMLLIFINDEDRK